MISLILINSEIIIENYSFQDTKTRVANPQPPSFLPGYATDCNQLNSRAYTHTFYSELCVDNHSALVIEMIRKLKEQLF